MLSADALNPDVLFTYPQMEPTTISVKFYAWEKISSVKWTSSDFQSGNDVDGYVVPITSVTGKKATVSKDNGSGIFSIVLPGGTAGSKMSLSVKVQTIMQRTGTLEYDVYFATSPTFTIACDKTNATMFEDTVEFTL